MKLQKEPKLNRYSRDERAATMLELALVLFLFFTTVLFFTDCARFFMTRALLIRGAQEAADLASRVPDFDIDTVTLTQASTDSARFRAARQLVANAAFAASSTNAVVSPSSGSGWVRLRSYGMNDRYSDTEVTSQPTDVLILRPGESGKWTPADGGSELWTNNPLRCSPSAVAATGCTARQAGDTMDSLMRVFPIMVQMEASVQTITPFVGPWVARATVLSWREQPAKSGYRDAQFATIPRVANTPPPVVDDQTPLPCETTGYGRCDDRGKCEDYCSATNCCYCQACELN